MIKKSYVLLLSVFVSACSTTGNAVLQRADGFSGRPDWAKEKNPYFYFEKNKIAHFVGSANIDGKSGSPLACLKTSVKTKENISSRIRERLASAAQAIQNDISVSPGNFIAIAGIIAVKLKRDDCYWEKVRAQKNAVRYNVFVKFSIPIEELKQTIANSAERNGSGREFSEPVNRHITEILQTQ